MTRVVYGKIVFLLGVLLAVNIAVAGCNTVEGVGEDVQAAGQGLENASKKVRE